jgi:predicted extracellular nuclease
MRIFVFALSLLMLAACGGGGTTAAITSNSSPGGGISVVDIQGSGIASPLVDQTVTVSAIVTGDFQDDDSDASSNLGGFYVQQQSPDADPDTSEGLFVFDGTNPVTDVNVGDRVDVTGTVAEYYGETRLKATTVQITGTGTIGATDLNLPASGVSNNSDGDSIADLERYEGMLVRMPQKMTITSLRFLERYGEVRLSEGGRLRSFTNGNAPDVAAHAAHLESIASRNIVLDDGLEKSNPSEPRYLKAGTADDYSIRVGDSITGATGNLRYSRGSGSSGLEGWRLMPTQNPVFTDDNPRPGAPSVAGSTRIAGFNLLNFFFNVDAGQSVCGPSGDANCRGADSNQEYVRQLEKIVTAIVMMDADIVGLIELENIASESIAAIVDGINARDGSRPYAYVDTGTIHTDAIRTAFIYDTDTVQETGEYAVLDASVDPRYLDYRNRPALAQSFEIKASGAVITLLVNHLKSKGSSCESGGDPDILDGQENCNLTRTAAAAAIADWMYSDPTASGDPDFLIIGDLNADIMEDPLTALKSAGLTSLLEENPDAYSYVFDAQAGSLDHAVASPSLASQVRETAEWHINADEPRLLDYNLENGRDPGLFDGGSPYRTSDHDPIIIGLDLTN